jgi:hypothetical protein
MGCLTNMILPVRSITPQVCHRGPGLPCRGKHEFYSGHVYETVAGNVLRVYFVICSSIEWMQLNFT